MTAGGKAGELTSFGDIDDLILFYRILLSIYKEAGGSGFNVAEHIVGNTAFRKDPITPKGIAINIKSENEYYQ